MDRIVLASASPRRAELLRAAGIEFDVMPPDVDETVHPGETPEVYVRRVAETKACAIANLTTSRLVLAADTTVVVDGVMLAKPANDEDARRMLRMLSGRAHEVLTAVCLLRGPKGSAPIETRVARTTVEFAPLTEDDIGWYVGTGESMDKAGAYAIQGYASRFVTGIAGSYSNVVGLPVSLVFQLLKGAASPTP